MASVVQVVGANGFIGRNITQFLNEKGHSVRAVTRKPIQKAQRERGVEYYILEAKGGGDGFCDLTFDDLDVLIFSAGRAHIRKECSRTPLDDFRKVNVELAMRFAKAAKAAGVRRFIYLSSIGVNGNSTLADNFFREDDVPSPRELYAVSKLEAEQALTQCFSGSNTELVIIRPPLVYGANAPGNFDLLLRLARSRWPMPLLGIKNRRSFIYVGNLVDFIQVCIKHPGAANEIFVVSDGNDVSTSQLLRAMREKMGKPARLFYVPKWLVRALACCAGKSTAVEKLYGSLLVDASKAHITLGWRPPYSLAQGLGETLR